DLRQRRPAPLRRGRVPAGGEDPVGHRLGDLLPQPLLARRASRRHVQDGDRRDGGGGPRAARPRRGGPAGGRRVGDADADHRAHQRAHGHDRRTRVRPHQGGRQRTGARVMIQTEVLVVGAGNAAMCAALAARDAGAEVLVLERAPEAERGGNTAFTAGAMRTTYDGIEDLRALMPDLTAGEIASTDFGAYPAQAFYGDMERVTEFRADPELVEILVGRSLETLRWMAGKGIRFAPAYGRQAFKVDGRFRFWGGLTVEVVGGGPGLVETEHAIAAKAGVEIRYDSRAESLLADDHGVHGAVAVIDGVTTQIRARAVVLACGGFQANAEWRTRYLGPGWDLAKVRGTRFNTGEGHRMALEAGAMPYGHWSGGHAVAWDRNAPEFGDLSVGDNFQKHNYPFSIMINARGERFVDEGAD